MPDLALVTGGTGFLGRELVAQLGGSGWGVLRISRKAPADRDTVTLDLERDPAGIVSLLVARRPPFIFHLAATTTVSSAIFSSNIVPLMHLLDAVREAARQVPDYSPRVLVAGSAAEYGDLGAEPIAETAREAPVSEYGVAKLAQTKLALARRRAGLDVLVARIFNVMGPGMPPSLAPSRFVRDALAIKARTSKANAGKATLAVGDLSPVRDYLDVEEAACALVGLSRADTTATHGIVNVCSGKPTPMRRLLDEILSQLGIDVLAERDPRLLKGPAEIPVSLGCPKLFERITGKGLSFNLERSVSRLLQPT